MVKMTANSPVRMEFDLYLDDGSAIMPDSAIAHVSDENGDVVGDAINVSVESSIAGATVDIPSSYNATDNVTGRVVTLAVTSNGASYVFTKTYLLEPIIVRLAVPSQSAMSVVQADIVANDFKDVVVDVWGDLSFDEKGRALRDAWSRISKIKLNPFRTEDEKDVEGVTMRMECGNFLVDELTSSEWAALPEHFIKSVRRAQLVEACVLSGGDPEWERRQSGLISKTVGESSEMFNTKPISDKRISERARREIARYISKRVIVSR